MTTTCVSDDYSIAAIRQLLIAAFADGQELRRFCMNLDVLRPVVSHFGPVMPLQDMIDKVIDFCRPRLLWARVSCASTASWTMLGGACCEAS